MSARKLVFGGSRSSSLPEVLNDIRNIAEKSRISAAKTVQNEQSNKLTETRAGNTLRLKNKAVHVLAKLAAKIGEKVGKETLIWDVWSNIVTTDDS